MSPLVDSLKSKECREKNFVATSAKTLEQFQNNGFVILENVISETAIEEMRDSITRLVAQFSFPDEDTLDALIRLNHENDRALYQIYKISHQTASMNRLREQCRRLVEQVTNPEDGVLIDVDSHIIFCIPGCTRLTWGWHQESTYDVFDGKGINFCLPIFHRATKENGTMSLLKGSHRKGKLPFDKVKEQHNGATSLVPKGIEHYEREFEQVYFEANPQDAVMFDRHLIHRSNPNHTSQPRITAVIRFMAIHELPDSLEKPY